MFKRIQKAILNQPLKTSLFIFVMTMLFISLAVSFIWKNATGILYKQMDAAFKPKMIIKADSVATSQNDFFISPYLNLKYTPSSWSDYDKKYYDDLNNLINSDSVLYGDISMVTSLCLKLVGYSDVDGLLINTNIKVSNDSIINVYNGFNEYLSNINNIYLHLLPNNFNRLASISKTNYSDLYYNEKDKLVAGRYFNEDEISNGAYKIILNQYPYYCDGENVKEVNIGDTVTYSLFNDDGEILNSYNFEVIGITDDVRRLPNDEYKFNLIPEKTFLEIMDNCLKDVKNELYIDKSYVGPYFYFPSVITLNNLDSLESFISEIESLNDRGCNYTYETNADRFIVSAGQLESLDTYFKLLFYFSLIVTILIMLSLICLDMLARKKEIGILAALGENKVNISFGIILEYLIKISISLLLAIIISNFISGAIENSININSTVDVLNDNGPSGDYSIKITITNIIQIIMMTICVALPSLLFSLVYILNLNVKEILLDDE